MNDLKVSGVRSFTVLTIIVGGVGISCGGLRGGATTECCCGGFSVVLIGFCFFWYCGVIISGGSGLLEMLGPVSLLVIVSQDAGGSPRELVVDRTSGEPR